MVKEEAKEKLSESSQNSKTIQLVERHIINGNHQLFAEIDELSFRSKNLYNLSNYHMRQEFFRSGAVLSYGALDKLLQTTEAYQALPAKVSQQVLIQVSRDWKSYTEADFSYKQDAKKFLGSPKIPKYKHKLKGRNLLVYTQQAVSKTWLFRGFINPSKTNLKIPTAQREVNQVRIVPQLAHFVVEVVYEIASFDYQPDKSKIAGIDIGLNNLAAVTSNQADFLPFLINGNPLKSINAYYNKARAALQSLLIGEQKTSQRIQTLTHKRNCRVDDYLHKASHFVIERLLEHRIGTLIIGKNSGWKQQIQLGKVNNQNFVSIPHARFIAMLEYKAEMFGIEVIIRDESHTSKCSFLDNEPIHHHEVYQGRRIKRGLFRSANGRLINADVNASANIIRKALPNAFADGIEAVVVRPLRIDLSKQVSTHKRVA
jgi:putative transposase